MEKLLIYYSQNKDKFKTKITRRYFIEKVGYKNQFDEVLVKVIDVNELSLSSRKRFTDLLRLYKK